MTNISDRIAIYVRTKGLSIRALEQSIGCSNGVISRCVTKKTDISSAWVSKIIETYNDINPDWLLTGQGEMLRTSPPTQIGTGNLMITGHDNVQVQGNSNNVATQPHPPTQTIDRALDEIAHQRQLLEKSQTQIDRLLAVIEHLTAPTN